MALFSILNLGISLRSRQTRGAGTATVHFCLAVRLVVQELEFLNKRILEFLFSLRPRGRDPASGPILSKPYPRCETVLDIPFFSLFLALSQP